MRRLFDERDQARCALLASERDLKAMAWLASDREAQAVALAGERDALALEIASERASRIRPEPHAPVLPARGWEAARHLESKCLFIVGHARSGTSILLEALNDSPEVFLLGEANLHQHGLMPHFAEWYNLMHIQMGNPPAKYSYCPLLESPAANGVECMEALALRYAFVGEKIAFRDVALGYNPEAFFEFQARYFLNANYVCVLRDPLSVLQSSAEMFGAGQLDLYARSYLKNLLLIANLYRVFPKVNVLVHERISADTFRALGERLGLDLSGSSAYYREDLQARRQPKINAPFFGVEVLSSMYERFCDVFSPDTLRAVSALKLISLQRALQIECAARAEPNEAISQASSK
jgi:hypothetical protein